jgi:hypothetical protein
MRSFVGVHKVVKRQISAHKFGLNFVGEIEQQFFAKCCVPVSFYLANKVW